MSKCYEVAQLTRQSAEDQINELLPLMALVDPHLASRAYLLGEERPDGAPLHAKWEHSFTLRQDGEILALALLYERQADGSELYRDDELHIGILAVKGTLQGRGMGSRLLRLIVDRVSEQPTYMALGGRIEHLGLTVADEKVAARGLYEAFGFHDVGTEVRGEELYRIMRASITDVLHSEKYLQTEPFL